MSLKTGSAIISSMNSAFLRLVSHASQDAAERAPPDTLVHRLELVAVAQLIIYVPLVLWQGQKSHSSCMVGGQLGGISCVLLLVQHRAAHVVLHIRVECAED